MFFTALARQKLVALGLYISSTVMMVCLFQRQMHLIAGLANVDFSSSQLLRAGGRVEDTASFPTNKFETVPAHFGLTQEQVGGSPMEPVQVHQTDISLCDIVDRDGDDEFSISGYDEYFKNTINAFPEHSDHKIAILTRRGGCSYADKARNAVSIFQQRNDQVKYLIIYDDHQNNDTEAKKSQIQDPSIELDTSSIPIMLLLVSHDTADAIISALEKKGDVGSSSPVMITIDTGNLESSAKKFYLFGVAFPGSFDDKIKLIAIQVIASVFVTVFAFLFTAGALLYFYRDTIAVEISRNGIMFSHIDSGDDPVDPKLLLTKEQVLSLPVIDYGGGGDVTDVENQLPTPAKKISKAVHQCNSTCSICLEDYELKEELRVLPCGHLFHTECIEPWLTTRAANCPLCKENFDVTLNGKDKLSQCHGLSNCYSCSSFRFRLRNVRRNYSEDSDEESDEERFPIIQHAPSNVEAGTPRRRTIQSSMSTD